jgi:hypothetical protein
VKLIGPGSGAGKGPVVARMKEYEPTDELPFLMELSIEPVAQQLSLLSATTVLNWGSSVQQLS